MKSRRNIKKTKRRSRHRNRKMTRRVKTKRGGMMRTAARAAAAAVSSPIVAARTFILHDVLPLFTHFNTKFGENPTPEQKAVVLKGERYFKSVADFPVDGPLKASINKLIDEFSSTEQNAQKALDIYNKILQALEDAEKRQKENITQTPGRARDTFSYRSMNENSPSLFIQGTSYGSQSSSSPFANTPQKLTNPPFNTPSKPNSTKLTTPPRLRPDEKGPQSITDNDKDLAIQGTRLFSNDENATPINSPFKSPPSVSSKSKSKSALGSQFSPSRPPFRLP
jgi:hypothetical protein